MKIDRIRSVCKKALVPITIMVIPHEDFKPLSLRIPLFGVVLFFLVLAIGAVQTYKLAVNGMEYPFLIEKVAFYTQKFSEWNSTVAALRESESEFRRIFSFKSKEKVLDRVNASNAGDVDIENLMDDIHEAVERVDEIKDYLRVQKDRYLATPKEYPVEGKITSLYGMRDDPITGKPEFHPGVDISAEPGAPVRATADGVVSYSGWTQESGYLIVIEHGCGFSTVCAHNKSNTVRRGQRVRRGEFIGYVGSTGRSSGPHVHYEVWEKGSRINPKKFLQGRS